MFQVIIPRRTKLLSSWFVINKNVYFGLSYVQGQSPEPKIREYFYYIDHQGMGQSPEPKIRQYFYYTDHQGMLFLDDSKMKNFTSCFKEKQFLVFFFKRIRPNHTGRYEEDFPFVSLCGRERNFIRCDDKPIVYTHLANTNGKDLLYYAHAGDALSVEFMPKNLCMILKTGRVYHPAPQNIYPVGLVQSRLAIELSQYFKFDNGEDKPPTHFAWNNRIYKTDNMWYRDFLPV